MSNARDKANIPALNFSSTGIDDNATSTAITIDSSQNVDVVGTTTSSNFISDGTGYGIKFPLNGTATLNTSSNSVIFTGSGSTGDYLAGTLNLQSRGNLDRDINLITGATASKTITAHGNGDVSFYEDTGTTAKLFWDASTERLGIGTTSPSVKLQILGTENSADTQAIRLMENATQGGFIKYDGNVNELKLGGYNSAENTGIRIARNDATTYFNTNGSERMRIDSSGNLLLNTTSQVSSAKLSINGIIGLDRTSTYNQQWLQSITHSGTSDYGTLYITPLNGQTTAGFLVKDAAGNNRFQIRGSGDSTKETVFNQSGADFDFRVESNNNANMLFVDGGNDRVGIGTSSPNNQLEIKSDTATVVTRLACNTGSGRDWGVASATDGAFGIYDYDAAAYRMRINNSGYVGISNTSPNYNLEIGESDGVSNRGLSFNLNNNVGQIRTRSNASDTQTHYEIINSNGTVGTIKTVGSATQFNTSSDYRLKENVSYDFDATSRLKQLKPARFNFIADANTTVDGFIAHEVQDVVPEAISGEKDAMRTEEYEITPAVLDENGNVITEAVIGTREVPDYQGIDQSKLVPLLVKTIQELEARITALETNNP